MNWFFELYSFYDWKAFSFWESQSNMEIKSGFKEKFACDKLILSGISVNKE